MTARTLTVIKLALACLCVLPLLSLGWRIYQDTLGPNPIEVVTRGLGEWALLFLLITLCMTPLRHALQQSWPLRLRRMLGLFSFFYAVLHLLSYLWFDQFFEWTEILRDILKRPFITVGMLAFVLLVPLALTSTQAMQRRMGRAWAKLHRLIYVIPILAILHFFWLVKADLLRPMALTLGVVLLLGYRLYRRFAPSA